SADSLALRDFLGCTITEATPVHASMTSIRQRLPQNVLDEVFTFVLRRLQEADLLHGKAFGIDATTLEANAAMKNIVRRDNGGDWKDHLHGPSAVEGKWRKLNGFHQLDKITDGVIFIDGDEQKQQAT
ncbi:MAG: hypothetical protein CMO80_10505, partial [Verrucomicrobiales bacterium]|nr:hypothetical protein [Verrucomicrobiales bacterium]